MERQLKNARMVDFTKGFHRTDCGQSSDNCNHVIKGGYITNSLAAFYLRWYRNSISDHDMVIIRQLAGSDETTKA